MRNLELKVPAADLADVRARCRSMGAVGHGILVQEDHFFTAPRALLKLRFETREYPATGAPGASPPSRAELIAYERPEIAGSRMSDYVVVPVTDPSALAEALARALGRGPVVRKSRELWMLGGTRIHLDEVEGLGTFVELETAAGDRPEEETRAEHETVIEALDLDRTRFLPDTYATLLARRLP